MDGTGEPAAKQPKIQEDTKNGQVSVQPELKNLAALELVSVLKDTADTKLVVIHAHAKEDVKDEKKQDAIVVLEKTPFDQKQLPGILSSTTLSPVLVNDIYGTYSASIDASFNPVKATVIYPCTPRHIDKYTAHPAHIIYETPSDYNNITLPWIESESFDLTWIENILTKKKESEFIIFEDADPVTGFLLLPDLKWDKQSMDNMYLSAIVNRRGVKSLRELTSEHLPMLKNILTKSLEAIERTYGISKDNIRAYFHYQPSYYHLHVHFNQVKYKAPGSNCMGAHLLSDVIDNIELYPEYYQERTLSFTQQENMKLYAQFMKYRKSHSD